MFVSTVVEDVITASCRSDDVMPAGGGDGGAINLYYSLCY